ncbi:MAG: TIGR04551 family protein [Myxococcales bacterium]|nr:TIGR04551 family protein [Myxococcales bacterium]MCB9716627.1 TIGR04551 family protein [Myxococcales bacterium]
MSLAAPALLATLALAGSPEDSTGGLGRYGDDLGQRQTKVFRVGGYFRLRGELQHDYDLDRGPSPSGQYLYPLPLGNPSRQLLHRADMRLRTDLGIYAPRGWVAVKVRVDALDDLALGSNPDGVPAATTTQRSPSPVLAVKRAYAELLTPLGVLAAGRMGNHWGLGMLANGGDCMGCDSGDASDRVAFMVPALQHVLAIAYDLSATGPFVPDHARRRVIDVEPRATVHSATFAVLRARSPLSLDRRRRAGRTTFEWGTYGSYRWQRVDVPTSYLPIAADLGPVAPQVMVRGYRAAASDLWLRLTGKWFRVEAEAAYLWARIDEPSLLPGVEIRRPFTSNQGGFAAQSDVGKVGGRFGAGLDLGFASGDRAPGFGAYPGLLDAPPQPGDIEGPQAQAPWDTAVNNFRFHPDFRVDRILFRELIGTVTDATYLRPHLDWHAWRHAHGRLTASLAGVASMAVEPTSTPGGARGLGVEVDPGLTYQTDFGLHVAFEPALLVPLAGLDNPYLGMQARPAQLYRLRLQYTF